MSTLNKFLVLFLVSECTLLFLNPINALFSETSVSSVNLFSAKEIFGTPSPTVTNSPTPTPTVAPGDIVINELFNSNQNDNEWVELFNKSQNTINVSGWKITDNNSTDIFPTISPIPPNQFAIIKTTVSNVIVPVSAITINIGAAIGNGLSGTGDNLLLENAGGIDIDAVSYGSDTSVFAIPPPVPSSTQSLGRFPNGIDTNSASDWQLDNSPTLGTSNSL